MKKNAIVYWLLPAKPERELFCEIVRILRKEFRAPNFEPHLTLFSTAKDRQPPNKVLKQISLRPIRLTASGVAFSSAFTRTLFVRLRSSPLLRKLVTDLARAAKSPVKASSDPQMTLLYNKYTQKPKYVIAPVI